MSLLTSVVAMAQTGVNTTKPQTTLDIKGKTVDGSKVEGVLTPQVTGDALKTMVANMGAAHNGNLIFVTTAVTQPNTDPVTVNVTFPGYYRFNYTAADAATNTPESKSFVRIEPSGLEKIETNESLGYRFIGSNEPFSKLGKFVIDAQYPFKPKDGNTNVSLIDLGDGGARSFTAPLSDIKYWLGTLTPDTGSRDYSIPNELNIYNYGTPIDYSTVGMKGDLSVGFGFLNKSERAANVIVGMGNESLGLGSLVFGYGNRMQTDSGVIAGFGISLAPTRYGYLGIGLGKFIYARGGISIGESILNNGGIAIGKDAGVSNNSSTDISAGTLSGIAIGMGAKTDSGISIGSASISGDGVSLGDGSQSKKGGTSINSYSNNNYEFSVGASFDTDYGRTRDSKEDTSFVMDDSQLFVLGNSGDNKIGYKNAVGGGVISHHDFSVLGSNALIVLRNAKTGIGLPTDRTTPANSKPTEMLDVNGNIRVRGDGTAITVGGACKNLGTISFYQDNFYGCKSTGWVKLNP